ncbi:TIGR03032 family protein [Spirulina major CS-329]|jgi:uncharacterized protein (TIGR03032 family)|uniref:TIGR03032 family protein n=1 Tax=Spirulina TaxID=1154 RepID=UPI0023301EB4|nr:MULTISPECIES: TIGR03032 family protein [Spirulina]MDB9493448.1 TIGR03032 family protein [Spirulina subsalsa CS-330]MDB9505197.1 TIGR03032 family protein [Spirulina major CS-329]
MSEPNPPLAVSCSRHALNWLAEQRISLTFTTYQTNRIFFLGMKPDQTPSIFERMFDRPMGLYATPERIYLGCRFQVWQLDNCLQAGETHNGYDKVYVPRVAHTTGDVDIHDIGLTRTQRVLFVNTLYSCLATISNHYSFIPLWQPPFITKLAPEDRCHLNGLAFEKGQPAYATAVSRSDVAAGWRQKRHQDGCVIDIRRNEVLLDTLSMPHSPRLYHDRLWVLNSGTGEFGYIDPIWQRFEAIAFCPGYLRGLAFHKDWAIVGTSKPRGDRTFSGLALDDQLTAKNAEAVCGLMIINLKTGNIDHWIQLEGVITELYDVQVLPGVIRPMALGFKTDEICTLITMGTPPTEKKRSQLFTAGDRPSP